MGNRSWKGVVIENGIPHFMDINKNESCPCLIWTYFFFLLQALECATENNESSFLSKSKKIWPPKFLNRSVIWLFTLSCNNFQLIIQSNVLISIFFSCVVECFASLCCAPFWHCGALYPKLFYTDGILWI